MKKLLLLSFGVLFCTQPLMCTDNEGSSDKRYGRLLVGGVAAIVLVIVGSEVIYYSSHDNYQRVQQEYDAVNRRIEALEKALRRRLDSAVVDDYEKQLKELRRERYSLAASLQRFKRQLGY